MAHPAHCSSPLPFAVPLALVVVSVAPSCIAICLAPSDLLWLLLHVPMFPAGFHIDWPGSIQLAVHRALLHCSCLALILALLGKGSFPLGTSILCSKWQREDRDLL